MAAEQMFSASQSSTRAIYDISRIVWVISAGSGASAAKAEFTKLKLNSTLPAKVINFIEYTMFELKGYMLTIPNSINTSHD